jgi:tetratricopeptide (TPR) repeat protein
MKVAVYAIALNEEAFVERWAASAAEADEIVLLDTGSTDETATKASEAGCRVVYGTIAPWRFDDARNAALAAVSADVDYCVALDLDEVLVPGWRAALEAGFELGLTRPRYVYTWSWNEDGSPGLQYGGDKIHARRGYRWRGPVHETCSAYGGQVQIEGYVDLEIHHHPDPAKSRAQYLPLLAMAVAEDPHNDRNAYYYARDLFFSGQPGAAEAEFRRHLALPSSVWAPERASSMRYLGKITGDSRWFVAATELCPFLREPWVDLSRDRLASRDWSEALEAAERALAITEKPMVYLCEPDAWGWAPYDVAGVASYYLGYPARAAELTRAAIELAPSDQVPRLQSNLALCEAAA